MCQKKKKKENTLKKPPRYLSHTLISIYIYYIYMGMSVAVIWLFSLYQTKINADRVFYK